MLGPDGRIVLVHQHGNSWSFPKGGLEPGENSLVAAVREIREETGLQRLILWELLGSYERYSIGPDGVGEVREWGNRKRTLFLFSTDETTFTPQDSEVAEVRYVTLNEASELLTHPKDREFLASVRDKIVARRVELERDTA